MSRQRREWQRAAAQSPRHGDVVMHCGHLEGRTHFWLAPDGFGFQRPDGSCGTARWLLACPQCFEEAGGNPLKVCYVNDDIWQGDEPIPIDKPERN